MTCQVGQMSNEEKAALEAAKVLWLSDNPGVGDFSAIRNFPKSKWDEIDGLTDAFAQHLVDNDEDGDTTVIGIMRVVEEKVSENAAIFELDLLAAASQVVGYSNQYKARTLAYAKALGWTPAAAPAAPAPQPQPAAPARPVQAPAVVAAPPARPVAVVQAPARVAPAPQAQAQAAVAPPPAPVRPAAPAATPAPAARVAPALAVVPAPAAPPAQVVPQQQVIPVQGWVPGQPPVQVLVVTGAGSSALGNVNHTNPVPVPAAPPALQVPLAPQAMTINNTGHGWWIVGGGLVGLALATVIVGGAIVVTLVSLH